jgi:hypothetical protein
VEFQEHTHGRDSGAFHEDGWGRSATCFDTLNALIFNLQKKKLNKPKDVLVLQMFCQFPKDFVKLNLEIDRTFVKSTNLLVYLTIFFVG